MWCSMVTTPIASRSSASTRAQRANSGGAHNVGVEGSVTTRLARHREQVRRTATRQPYTLHRGRMRYISRRRRISAATSAASSGGAPSSVLSARAIVSVAASRGSDTARGVPRGGVRSISSRAPASSNSMRGWCRRSGAGGRGIEGDPVEISVLLGPTTNLRGVTRACRARPEWVRGVAREQARVDARNREQAMRRGERPMTPTSRPSSQAAAAR